MDGRAALAFAVGALLGFGLSRRILVRRPGPHDVLSGRQLEILGTGRDWAIEYWWPFRTGPDYWFMNPRGWDFYSWQNILIAFLLLLWTIWIAPTKRCGPMDAFNIWRRMTN